MAGRSISAILAVLAIFFSAPPCLRGENSRLIRVICAYPW